MEKKSYGSWVSPISADLVATAGHGLGQLKALGGNLFWLEQLPEEAGRSVVMGLSAGGEEAALTPKEMNVRTRVHEYGGGDYLVADDAMYFSNDKDQRLYCYNHEGFSPLTAEPDSPRAVRYADGILTVDKKFIICVREMHHGEHQVENDLVAVATDGSGDIKVISAGDDFYSSPSLNADGNKLAWLSWNHPQMPWDGTTLYLADLDAHCNVANVECVAGGEEESVYQPTFSPAGVLHFVSDRSGWWNIYKKTADGISVVCDMQAECGYPQWIFGTNTYVFINEDEIAVIAVEKGQAKLGIIKNNTFIALDLPYNDFAPTLAMDNDSLFFIGASATIAPSIVSYNLKTSTATVLRHSSSCSLDPSYFSTPEALEFPTGNEQTAYGYLYPPNNPQYEGLEDELPPLMVICHGGPTSSATTALKLKIQYWTSRGFAVMDVNYRGSTGYGRAYRDALKGQWGVYDVEDCVNAAKYLVSEKRVNPDRMIIKGSSAGGYTVLSALAFYDVFSVGVSYYGVADLTGLVADTHKFEAKYMDVLIAPYPEGKALYEQRSPLQHADNLSCPILFLQGLEDKVVPPSQPQAMIAALNKKSLPYAYVTFDNEGHGFRDAKNIRAALEAELYFYGKIFSIDIGEQVPEVPVMNL